MTAEELDAAVAKAEAQEAGDLKTKASAAFDEHEALGDACVADSNATLEENLRRARAGEEFEPSGESQPCDDFWNAVAEDLPGQPREALGIHWASWRDEHGKPRPDIGQ